MQTNDFYQKEQLVLDRNTGNYLNVRKRFKGKSHPDTIHLQVIYIYIYIYI